MKKAVSVAINLVFITLIYSQELHIEGDRFYNGDKPIWFNGINTPWHDFNDFGKSFDQTWWENEFIKYKESNINLVRVWIHCSGEYSPAITEEGFVTGASDKFWAHFDSLVAIARLQEIYLLPCLWSFDMTKDKYPTYQRYRKLLADREKIKSYVENFLIPLVKKYDYEPYLMGWEICNEPEWMFEDEEVGKIPLYNIQLLHALCAAAIHKHSSKPVTTGSAAIKWNSETLIKAGEMSGNLWSDKALQKVYSDKEAYLDFYQVHWYPWQTKWMSSPYQKSPADYKIDDRPVLIGETLGKDHCDEYICLTLAEMYDAAYKNGYAGVCAWKTPQNDGSGTFEAISKATKEFYLNHAEIVCP